MGVGVGVGIGSLGSLGSFGLFGSLGFGGGTGGAGGGCVGNTVGVGTGTEGFFDFLVLQPTGDSEITKIEKKTNNRIQNPFRNEQQQQQQMSKLFTVFGACKIN